MNAQKPDRHELQANGKHPAPCARFCEATAKVLEGMEPVYQYQLANGNWIDQTKESYDYNVKHGQATVRMLYATPQAAAQQAQPERAPLMACHCFDDIARRYCIDKNRCSRVDAYGIKQGGQQ